MSRSMSERIHNDQKKMMRKVKILKERDMNKAFYANHPEYTSLSGFAHGQIHRLDKGKIHCSCWMCSGYLKNEMRIRDLRRMEEIEHEDDFGT
jgi:hypothetical protein